VSPVTVLGAGGFIGRTLVAHLRAAGRPVNPVTRADLPGFLALRPPVGDLIYCIGLTADFRTRPLDTAEAHVGLVGRMLAELDFRSFMLLSSTRVYGRAEVGREGLPLTVQPGAPDDLYNITKLAGEALCLSDARPAVRVARLSNVYGAGMGAGNFLGQVLAEGAARGAVTLRQNLRSAKDYIAIAEVLPALLAIAERGAARLYNVASGVNTTHDAIVRVLSNALGWHVSVHECAAATRFPRIDVTRLTLEFGAPRNGILEDLPELVSGLMPTPTSRRWLNQSTK
jgi:nucleoside-diphosphate-sugar epimerase